MTLTAEAVCHPNGRHACQQTHQMNQTKAPCDHLPRTFLQRQLEGPNTFSHIGIVVLLEDGSRNELPSSAGAMRFEV